MTFNELGLRSEVLTSITEMGYEAPTPIQLEAIPALLTEERDLVGLAQTGTGKTAAFGLPLINKVKGNQKHPEGLIICPTRELCLQIARDLEAYSKYIKDISITPVYGGTDIRRQMTQIKRGTSIIVATPGRLVDLIKRKAISMKDVNYVVLDEADEMLNMGFKEDIDLILEQTPSTKNTWLFSATMPKEVSRIAGNYMTDPVEISIGHKNQSNENIEHIFYTVKERNRYDALKRLIDTNPDIYGLVFCRTKMETAMVAEKLGKDGYSAEPLHGDLSQQMRDRVMKRFRQKDIQILVATDVAARGIDVDNISHVINYNLPDDIENYTHRSGRTARAGNKGESMVLINPREKGKIKAIERQIKTTFTEGKVPNPTDICKIQLSKLVNKVVETKVNEEELSKYEDLLNEFKDMSKEDVVKKFISAEFNRFFEYYNKAGNLNEKADSRSSERSSSSRSNGNMTRFFMNLGTKDGLNKGGLLRLVCDNSGLKSGNVGRIDILGSYAFFEVEKSNDSNILSTVNGSEYEGKEVSVEITHSKGGGGKNKSKGSFNRSNSGGKRPPRRNKSFGKPFKASV